MNLSLRIPSPRSPAVKGQIPPIAGKSANPTDKSFPERERSHGDSSEWLASSGFGEERKGHYDFNAHLMEMLVRFTNCHTPELEVQLGAAFGVTCDLLEIEHGALWLRSSRAAKSATLSELYPRPQGKSPLEPSADPGSRFPWITEQVRCGRMISFSNASELPPEAQGDRE